MKLFISYSHSDGKYIERFIKQLAPITGADKLITDVWYDREITAGDDFWDRINQHLDNRDIICLFISPDYIASKSCREELRRALIRRKEDGILVIPIVLRPCPWLDLDESLTKILAAPTDGKPVSKFDDEDDAWMDVYNQVKKAVEKYSKIREIRFKQSHLYFLNDATTFAKSNPNKTTLTLDDVFVYPDLDKIERDGEAKRQTSQSLISNYSVGDRFVVVGEDQSGKTSLLKKFIIDLRERGYYPIYVKDPAELLQGNFSLRVSNVFKEQYETEVELSDLNEDKIVALVDDFHKAKNKEKVLQHLLKIKGCIIVVDDIYTIDAQNDLLSDFSRYEIKQLKLSQRIELIKKWLLASDVPLTDRQTTNEDLKRIDETSAMIEETLGRVLGKGIMPAYAYFILTLLVVNEDNDKPLDEKITSQGHCYQALIVLFLKKQGVSNANMDSYINFLVEFAIKIYDNHGQALTSLQFEDFVKEYKDNYNLTDSLPAMLEKLETSNIMHKTTFGNYEFTYPYIYYYFAGKFFAQSWEDEGDPNHGKAVEEIDKILVNLHKTSNAYIAVFIAHHTKNTALINKMTKVANDIYSKFEPATLDKECLKVFSGIEQQIATPSLPAVNTPSENRRKDLEHKDRIEIEAEKQKPSDEDDETDNEFALELRRSIKTVEVLGSIIKNRAGSLRNDQLERLFEDAMDVQLRHVSNFLELVKSITESEEGTKFLEERIKEAHPEVNEDELPIRANMLFWAMNFCFIFSVIKKTAFSLGSASVVRVAKSVCERRNTPASFLLKHTILMWFKKNVVIDELQKMDKILDNRTAKNAMLWLISDYCRVHVIDYKDASKLQSLGIKKQVLLPSPEKEKK